MSLTSYRAAPPRVNLTANAGRAARTFRFVRPRGLRPLRADGALLHPASILEVSFGLPESSFRQLKGAACAARAPDWRACFVRRRFGFLQRAFCRPGSDLLSRVLRRSTISAGAFHGRVRNGIGCSRSAITTRSAKRTLLEKLFSVPRRQMQSVTGEARKRDCASPVFRRPRLSFGP